MDGKRRPIHIRWMIRRDMVEVLAIERESFAKPWSEVDFIRCLKQRNCIGMVAERDERVVGFMVYELHRQSLLLVNLAVAADCRGQDVGSQLVDKLRSKLTVERRRELGVVVAEDNLNAQLFFRGHGFRATEVLREYFDEVEPPLDAYRMVYRVKSRKRQTREVA
jgi:ribosomal-protein-alanine N-acetyltransferase